MSYTKDNSTGQWTALHHRLANLYSVGLECILCSLVSYSHKFDTQSLSCSTLQHIHKRQYRGWSFNFSRLFGKCTYHHQLSGSLKHTLCKYRSLCTVCSLVSRRSTICTDHRPSSNQGGTQCTLPSPWSICLRRSLWSWSKRSTRHSTQKIHQCIWDNLPGHTPSTSCPLFCNRCTAYQMRRSQNHTNCKLCDLRTMSRMGSQIHGMVYKPNFLQKSQQHTPDQ